MPYESTAEIPDYVPAAKKKQWLEVFNSAYARARKKKPNAGKDKWEASAFAQANAVAGPNAKVEKYSEDQPRDEQGRFAGSYGDTHKAGERAKTIEQHRQAAIHHQQIAEAHAEAANEAHSNGDTKTAERESAIATAHKEAASAHSTAHFAQEFKEAPRWQAHASDLARNASVRANQATARWASKKVAKHEGNVQYTDHAKFSEESCHHCIWYEPELNGHPGCLNYLVSTDDTIEEDGNHNKIISPGGWCEYFEKEEGAMKAYRKRIPFAKVDVAKREVWGIVTAEVPDKDDEVCDYTKSKPYYEKVIAEFSKATNGENFFPLREMHQLSAVGKCIGFEFRDVDKEIYMGFKVVDDDAWKKVVEKVYTGFSHGGSIVGEMIPDTVFEGCMRYTANPSEVSLVDNPCLSVAHYTMIRADGAVELVKITPAPDPSYVGLAERVTTLEAVLKAKRNEPTTQQNFYRVPLFSTDFNKKEKKKPGVKYLASDSDGNGYLPYTGPDGKPDHRLMGAAWAALHGGYRGKKYEGPDKSGAISRLKGIYDKEGMDTPESKIAALRIVFRKAARAWANRHTAKGIRVAKRVRTIDTDLGILDQQSIRKTLYDAGRLACYIQDMSYMVYCLQSEKEVEEDDSPTPQMLADNISDLLDTLQAIVDEERKELTEELNERVSSAAATGVPGVGSPVSLGS